MPEGENGVYARLNLLCSLVLNVQIFETNLPRLVLCQVRLIAKFPIKTKRDSREKNNNSVLDFKSFLRKYSL